MFCILCLFVSVSIACMCACIPDFLRSACLVARADLLCQSTKQLFSAALSVRVVEIRYSELKCMLSAAVTLEI